MESYKIMHDEVKVTIIDNIEQTITTHYIQRVSDLALIPCNKLNKDYLQYLEDVQNGAEVLPFDYQAEETIQQEALALYNKNKRIEEIKLELNELDLKVIRPLLDNETERINEIKAQKVVLREELSTLL